jgi:tRNA(Ile)-lysidine synthase
MLLQAVRNFLLEYQEEKNLFVGLSGGVDSVVLLHALAKLRTEFPEINLKAIHVNHGLNKKANDWERFCEQLCLDLNIPLHVETINLSGIKSNIEEQARDARYAVFKEVAQEALVLTAHHASDQAETVMLQLCRGAGIKGLAGMQESMFLSETTILARPLLSVSQQAILDYAKENNLQWVEDDSNQLSTFSRNFIRHEVLPLLAKRWPAVESKLNHTAELMADGQTLLDQIAEEDFFAVQQGSSSALSLQLMHDRAMSDERIANLLRFWISAHGFKVPSKKQMAVIFKEVINAAEDARPVFQFDGAEIRRWREGLFLMPELRTFDSTQCLPWLNLNEDLFVSVELPPVSAEWLNDLNLLPADKVEVRFRQGGEKIKIPGRQGSHDLKKIMQERNVPYWLRDRVPLIYVSGELRVLAW